MATYIWKGKNRQGQAIKGERVAASAEELTLALQKDQIAVSSVVPKKATFSLLPSFLRREKVKQKELAIYSRQLSVLIDAELPLIQSLNILSEQTRNKYFKKVIGAVREDVESGASLNQAKRKQSKVFDDLYCNMVASGEQSGSLDVILKRLAEYIEQIVRLKSQVRQAMIYPAAILCFSLLVAIFLLWKVIPIFTSIFVEMGAELPFITQMTVSFSNFISKYIVFVILGLTALVFLFRYIRRTDAGREAIDRYLLRMPLFGRLLIKVSIARMTRTLSTLLSGGVSMLESLKITSSTAGNVVFEKGIMDVRRRVTEGKSLTESFREGERFPFMLTQMVSVGEATGTLDNMLAKMADFYDEEVSSAVGSLLSVLEPILLIFVGGLVGGLVVSMYLPIFNLMQQF